MIFRPYLIEKPKPSSGFVSLEEEWLWLQNIRWELESEREAVPPYFVALPLYLCRHGGDSEQIRKKYIRARATVAQLLSGTSCQQAIKKEVSNL